MAYGLNTIFSSTAGVLVIDAGDQYSDAITRDMMNKTSVQCDKEIIVQVSNVPTPDMETDDDWYDAASGKFVPVNPSPYLWLRVKLLEVSDENVPCFICSTRSNY